MKSVTIAKKSLSLPSKPTLYSMLSICIYCLLYATVKIDGFIPQQKSALTAINGRLESLETGFQRRYLSRIILRATGSGGDKNNQSTNDGKDDEEYASDFFFDMSKTNIDARSSMDVGIHELLGGGSSISTSATNSVDFPTTKASSPQSSTVVVMDWECLLDAIPYHIELGIHAARTTWPHLNDLCNFDTDRDWLENKLFAMSHVLGSPEGPDKFRHIACEYALATRLILEEQAMDRNESTGKNGKYSRKFHPRFEINGNNDFDKDQSRSRRPLTAGELAVNWREFIRSTLIVKYARGPDGRLSKQNPMEALEQAIEEYVLLGNKKNTGNVASQRVVKSLSLFPQTKFALLNSSSKLVIRISHKLDNDIVAKSLNKQLRLVAQERIAKTYKAENAIRRLFLQNNNNHSESNSKHIVLLLKPDPKDNASSNIDIVTSEENCLQDIMKFTHHCDMALQTKEKQDVLQTDQEKITPSVVWIDSSWHRLQGLAPVFGDTIPGGKNGNRNTARCSFGKKSGESEESDENVWLSLWLAEWPSQETSGSFSSSSSTGTQKNRISSSSSENHEAAMVYPWTDSLSWETAEDILIPTTWGSSDNAFQ